VIASPKEPWWLEIPDIRYYFYANCLTAFYFLVAFIELISYYATGYDNNGKYLIKRSKMRVVLFVFFFGCLGIFLVVYSIVIVLVIVWAILGAVMNPSIFLPYAAAAGTLMAVVGAKLANVEGFHKKIKIKVDNLIKEKIEGNLKKSMEKYGSKIGAKAGFGGGGDNEDGPNALEKFQGAILSALPFDTSKSSPEEIQAMLAGSIEAAAKIISDALGIHKTLVLLLLAGIK